MADSLVRYTTIHDTVAGNAATYPALPLPLTTLATNIAAFSTAEAAAKLHTTGAVAERDNAQKQVIDDLNQYRAYVQTLCNADPKNAETLAKNAAMYLRNQTRPAKSDLAVKHVSTGVVKVVAKAIKGAKTYDWQYSLDAGKTWSSLPPTTKASTTITGLLPGVVVAYRHRAITKVGTQDWGQDISAMVV